MTPRNHHVRHCGWKGNKKIVSAPKTSTNSFQHNNNRSFILPSYGNSNKNWIHTIIRGLIRFRLVPVYFVINWSGWFLLKQKTMRDSRTSIRWFGSGHLERRPSSWVSRRRLGRNRNGFHPGVQRAPLPIPCRHIGRFPPNPRPRCVRGHWQRVCWSQRIGTILFRIQTQTLGATLVLAGAPTRTTRLRLSARISALSSCRVMQHRTVAPCCSSRAIGCFANRKLWHTQWCLWKTQKLIDGTSRILIVVLCCTGSRILQCVKYS